MYLKASCGQSLMLREFHFVRTSCEAVTSYGTWNEVTLSDSLEADGTVEATLITIWRPN